MADSHVTPSLAFEHFMKENPREPNKGIYK